MIKKIFLIMTLVGLVGCNPASKEGQSKEEIKEGSFAADVNFLKQFTDIIVLQEPSGKAKVAISPALQGRVMTSSSNGSFC